MNLKEILVANMSHDSTAFQDLVKGLSIKELNILRKHSDLLARVRRLSQLNTVQLMAELQEEYDLEIDSYPNGNHFVGSEKLDAAVPSWVQSSPSRWFQDLSEFDTWAQEFLMQEVRINIWIRYCEHKKNPKPTPSYGMYV